MKRMQKIIVLVLALCLILSVGIFVACEEVHEHSFDGEYDGDKTNHWRLCSCGAKGEAESHVDEDGDEKCDVCGMTIPHVHNFDAWRSDDIKHWKVCSKDEIKDESSESAHVNNDGDYSCDVCGHHIHGEALDYNESYHWWYCPDDQETLRFRDHIDEDGDGICDVCEYVMHVHSYTELSYNESQHWYYCPDDNEILAKVDHVDEDGDGICDVCEYVIFVHSLYDFIVPKKTSDSYYVPTANSDGQGILSCSDDDCDYSETIVLKYFSAGEPVSYTAQPDEVVYFFARKDGYSVFVPDTATMIIGETTTVEYFFYDYLDYSYKFVSEYVGIELEEGSVILSNTEDFNSVLFKVSASDGNIFFTMDYAPGAKKSSAIAVDKDKLYSSSATDEVWFKYTATKDEDIVLYNPSGCYFTINEYDSTHDKYSVYSLNAGETLYITIGWADYSFKLFEKEEGVSYDGWSFSTAIKIETDEYSASGDVVGTMYYKFTASQAGRVSVTINEGNAYCYLGYNYYGWFNRYYDAPYAEVGDELYISVTCDSEASTSSYSLSISYAPLSEVDNEFIVKDMDGNAVAGVLVSLKDSAGDVVYSATTDENGKATISFVPANYTVELSGFDSDTYSYLPVSTIWDKEDSETDKGQTYNITLVKPVSKTFIVKGGDSLLEGVTVTIVTISYPSSTIASGVTDADGKVVLSYVPGSSSEKYKVELSNIPDMYYPASTFKFYTTDTEDLPITLSVKNAFTVKVIAPSDIAIAVEGLTVSISSFGTVQGTGVTDANGDAVIYLSYDNEYDVSVSGLPYYIKGVGVLAYGSRSIEITLEKVDFPELSVGDNSFSFEFDFDNNEWEILEYVFISENGGSYEMTFKNDENYSAYVYINSFYDPVLSNSHYFSAITSHKFSLSEGEAIVFCITSNTYDEVYECSYTLVVAEVEGGSEDGLSIGENQVLVGHNGEKWDFVDYTFTSVDGGSYIATIIDSIGGGTVYNMAVNEWEAILADDEDYSISTYKFTLSAGESITFSVSSNNYGLDGDHSFVLKIAVDDGSADETVSELSFGDNLVLATYSGNKLTFTAEYSGSYVISSKNENFCILDGNLDELANCENPYYFELTEGESIEFLFSVYYTTMDEDTYVVTIDNAMAK